MGVYKLSNNERNKTNIIKLYFRLYPYWKKQYKNCFCHNNNFSKTYLLNLIFIEKIMLLNLEKNEDDIIKNSLMYKKKGIEYIAYSMFYSESGLRNRVNILCKEILLRLEEDKIFCEDIPNNN